MILVEKPWGYEKWLAYCKEYVMKEIFIKKGFKTSLQYHNQKKETNYVFSGKVKLTLGEFTTEAVQGTVVEILPGIKHQITAVDDSLLFEVSTYHLNDVIRLEDSYGRDVINTKTTIDLTKQGTGVYGT